METVLVLLLIIVLLSTFFLLPPLLLRRAVIKVVRMFRQKNALETENARSIVEIGIKPQKTMERLFKKSDYRLQALQFLLSHEIVKEAGEGKLYLSEERLASTRRETSSKLLKIIIPPHL